MTELSDVPMRLRLWLLFIIFAKIAAFVVGGGYVILPMVEQELVYKRKWLKSEEFVDMTAVVQTIPGIIAGNSAIYLGYRIAGIRGAICALAGVATPSVIIILVIAMCINMLPESVLSNARVQGAFVGVQAAVCGMVFATAIKMSKKVFTGIFELCIGIVGLAAVCFFPISPGLVMVASGVIGVVYLAFRRRWLEKPESEQ